MAMGRDKAQWNHTSSLLAIVATAWLRRKGQRAARPEQFNPYLRGKGGGRGIPLRKGNLHLLAIAMGAEGAPKP